MFSSLSFKKLRRRIRTITLFKKLSKKLTTKQKVSKQQEGRIPGNDDQCAAQPDPISARSPEIIGSYASTSDTSSDAETSYPPTPVSVSSNAIPPAVVPVAEHVSHDPTADSTSYTNVEVRTENTILPVEKEKAAVAKEPATVHGQVSFDAAQAIQTACFPLEDEEVAREKNSTSSDYGAPELADESARNMEITTYDSLDGELNNSDPVPIDSANFNGSAADNGAEAAKQNAVSLHDHEQDSAGCSVQVREITMQSRFDDEPRNAELCNSFIVEDSAQGADVVRQDAEHGDLTPVGSELAGPPVVASVPKSPRLSATGVDGVLEQTLEQPPPQTPRSGAPVQVCTPNASPRKRVASEVRPNQDESIMSELQASVRSREKRRLEKEKIEAAEKKREERELRQSVAAAMGMDFTELGVRMADSPVDRESVLRDVRSWRKQREASLKGKVDDTSQTAAIREALSNEAIMVDLMSAVQSRASRAPCFTDPREKRQTVLEDLFARRVRVGQV